MIDKFKYLIYTRKRLCLSKKMCLSLSAVLLLTMVSWLFLKSLYWATHWLTKYWMNTKAQTTNGTNRVTQNCWH